jgi:hypothetical protein
MRMDAVSGRPSGAAVGPRRVAGRDDPYIRRADPRRRIVRMTHVAFSVSSEAARGVVRRVSSAACATAVSLAFAGAAAAQSPPPIPPLASVQEWGVVKQTPLVHCRDGTYSALVEGRSVWTFGDTCLKKGGVAGDTFIDNSLADATDLDASDGIFLNGNYQDSEHVPRRFIPYTPWELSVNAKRAPDDIALWPGQLVPDPARHRELIFFGAVFRGSKIGFHPIGGGIAVADPTFTTVTRPPQNPDPNAKEPSYMWRPNEIEYNAGAVLDGDMLYCYGGEAVGLTTRVHVARVPLADALDKAQWRYWDGTTWNTDPAASATVYHGGAAGDTIFFDAYLGLYVSVYQHYLDNDIEYRVARHPEGPWSDEALMFTARQGTDPSYAARVHPEFSENGGQVIYVTYVMTTGLLQQHLETIRTTFAPPVAGSQ